MEPRCLKQEDGSNHSQAHRSGEMDTRSPAWHPDVRPGGPGDASSATDNTDQKTRWPGSVDGSG